MMSRLGKEEGLGLSQVVYFGYWVEERVSEVASDSVGRRK